MHSKEYLRRFEEVLKIKKLSKTTNYHYTLYIKKFLTLFDEISPSTLRRFQSVHPNHMAYYSLKLFLKSIDKQDLIRFLIKPRVNKNKLPEYLTREEVFKLIEVLRTRIRNDDAWLLVWLMWDTGLRISSALSLRVANIDFNERLIRVIVKGGKALVIPFSRDLGKEIDIYIRVKGLSRHDYLFEKSRRNYFGIIKKYSLKYLGKSVYPHMIRHSFAVYLLKRGVPLNVIQRLLGHSDVRTTTIYTSLVPVEIIKYWRKAMGDDKGAEEEG